MLLGPSLFVRLQTVRAHDGPGILVRVDADALANPGEANQVGEVRKLVLGIATGVHGDNRPAAALQQRQHAEVFGKAAVRDVTIRGLVDRLIQPIMAERKKVRL